MIYYSIPWHSQRNIGSYYNEFMKLLPDSNDYGCFMDGDACFTTSDFGSIIESHVANKPDVGLWTCLTNRVGCPYQVLRGIEDSNDMKYHRNIGKKLAQKNQLKTYQINYLQPLSGMFILLKKKYWEKCNGFREKDLFGVDNYIHMDLNDICEIRMMLDLYVFHWYRGRSKFTGIAHHYPTPKIFSINS